MQSVDGNRRLFLALWPDETIRQQLIPLIPPAHGRSVKPANLHITLVFLGNTSSQDAMQLIQCINQLRLSPFKVCLDRTGGWRKAGIFQVGMQQVPDELFQLVESLRTCIEPLGISIDNRPYKPHVTLARKIKQRIQTDKPVNIEWPVDRFVLVESCQIEGSVEYKVIHEWWLKK